MSGEHLEAKHYENVRKLCRICAQMALKTTTERKLKPLEIAPLKQDILLIYGTDISNDHQGHSSSICRRCYATLIWYRKKPASLNSLEKARNVANKYAHIWTLFEDVARLSECSLCEHIQSLALAGRPAGKKRSHNTTIHPKSKLSKTSQQNASNLLPTEDNNTSYPSQLTYSSLPSYPEGPLSSCPLQSSSFPPRPLSSSLQGSMSHQRGPPAHLTQPQSSSIHLGPPILFGSFQEEKTSSPFPSCNATIEDTLSFAAQNCSSMHETQCNFSPFQPSKGSLMTSSTDIEGEPVQEPPVSFLEDILSAPLPPLGENVSLRTDENNSCVGLSPIHRPFRQNTHSVVHSTPNRTPRRFSLYTKTPSPQSKRKLTLDFYNGKVSTSTSPIKSIQPTLKELCFKSVNEPLAKEESIVCTQLAKKVLQCSTDRNVLVLKTGGQPLYFRRVQKPRKTTDGASSSNVRQRVKQLSKIREFVAGGGTQGRIAQHAAELKYLTKEARNVLSAKLGWKRRVVLNKRYGLAMQAYVGLNFSQMRRQRQFLRHVGVYIENENYQRKELLKLLPHEIVVTNKMFEFLNDEDETYRKEAPLVHVRDVNRFASDILDCYTKNNLLTWHNGGIPENEIWLKIGGDHGRHSFKLCMQVANLKKPNSKRNTILLGIAKVKDTPHNLSLIFEEFSHGIRSLNGSQYYNKTIRIIIFGDYSFLANLYGLSGAASTFPCLWCLKSKQDLQKLGRKHSIAEERTLEKIKLDHQNFVTDGKSLKCSAAKYNNVIREPLIDIPLEQVAPPALHILLGIVKKHHTLLEKKCDETDDNLIEEMLIQGNSTAAVSGGTLWKKYEEELRQIGGELEFLEKNEKNKEVEIDLEEQFDEKESEIDLLKKNFPTRKGPICSSLDNVLQLHKIIPQAYHGRSFVGNHCQKYLRKNVYQHIARQVKEITNQFTESSTIISQARTTAETFQHLTSLYAHVHKIISHSKVIPNNEYDSIEKAIKTYTKFYRANAGAPVFPKMHFLEDHCLAWIRKYKFGLGLHSEQGGEQLHKSLKILEIQSLGITREEDKLVTVMRKHLTQVSPDLYILTPKIRKRHKKSI